LIHSLTPSQSVLRTSRARATDEIKNLQIANLITEQGRNHTCQEGACQASQGENRKKKTNPVEALQWVLPHSETEISEFTDKYED
jgi:hypothetical protein